jgi:hypothetical protein
VRVALRWLRTLEWLDGTLSDESAALLQSIGTTRA